MRSSCRCFDTIYSCWCLYRGVDKRQFELQYTVRSAMRFRAERRPMRHCYAPTSARPTANRNWRLRQSFSCARTTKRYEALSGSPAKTSKNNLNSHGKQYNVIVVDQWFRTCMFVIKIGSKAGVVDEDDEDEEVRLVGGNST